jgi:multimeric flavodoxin WrbA
MAKQGEKMNVLGICGSPHPEGNTAYALKYALNVVKAQGIETTYLSLHDKVVAPCRGCFACRDGECVQKDEMGEVIEAIRRCDGLILASPVYMGLITGQME